MNLVVLYLLMLKATFTTFSGPTSLPVLREDFVVRHHILTDRQLTAAVVTGRSSPGPMGIYVVSVGYQAAGLPGALLGWLAMLTPAFLIVPIIRYIGHHAENPRVQQTLRAVILTSSGLVIWSAIPLAQDAISGRLPAILAILSFLLVISKKVETIWVIAGCALFSALLTR